MATNMHEDHGRGMLPPGGDRYRFQRACHIFSPILLVSCIGGVTSRDSKDREKDERDGDDGLRKRYAEHIVFVLDAPDIRILYSTQERRYASEAMKVFRKPKPLVSTGSTLQIRVTEQTKVDRPQ